MQGLLERKRLQLVGLQRALRSQVAAEQRLQQDADVAKLADWTAWRRPMPDQLQLPPPPLVLPVRRAADTSASTQELHAEMLRCVRPWITFTSACLADIVVTNRTGTTKVDSDVDPTGA
jgi:hypothetical protein